MHSIKIIFIISYRFQAELHIVHYKASYGSFVEAVRHPDGLAVLAVLIELERRDNTAFRHIVEQFPEIQTEGLETNLLSPIPLADLLPDNVLNFYRYNGFTKYFFLFVFKNVK